MDWEIKENKCRRLLREWAATLEESVGGHEGGRNETEMKRSIKHISLICQKE